MIDWIWNIPIIISFFPSNIPAVIIYKRGIFREFEIFTAVSTEIVLDK